ncbi:MAG: hypothetical protein AAF934_11525 [Bacteroidota bacterium]
MTFIVEYRELKRLFKGYYNYLIAADKELTKAEKLNLIKELFHVHAKIERIENMSFQKVRKTCYYFNLEAPSKLNGREL